MPKSSRPALAILTIMLLCGCTRSLTINHPGDLTRDDKTTLSGAPWPLYMDQFAVATTYSLASCEPMRLEIEPDVTVSGVPDPEHSYMIDPNSLSGLFKTSKFESTYHPDGSPATINAEADDRTGEAIAGLVKAAAGIAKIAAAGAGVTDQTISCNAKTQDLFDKATAQTEIVKKAKANLETAQIEFERWKAEVDATSGTVATDTQTNFNSAYRALAMATMRLESAKKSLAELRKPISVSHTFLWPEQGGDETIGRLETPEALKAKLKSWAASPGALGVNPGDYALDIVLAPKSKAPLAVPKGMAKLDQTKLLKGIPYRVPVPATLTITWTEATAEGREGTQPQQLLEKAYTVRQLGRIVQLPCVSRPFTSITCGLAFNDKGQLTKVGAANTKAPGEAVATMVVAAVDSASGAVDAIRARDERRRTAGIKRKQEELAELELEAKLKAAREALQPAAEPSAQKAAENAILRYETDLQLRQAKRLLDEDLARYPG